MRSVTWRVALAVGAVALLSTPAAGGVANRPPVVKPIAATFDQAKFQTVYTAAATDPDGDKLAYAWSLLAPAADPACKTFAQTAATQAVWHHGDKDNCNHAVQGPRGHLGTVVLKVSDGTWTCTETYAGTIDGVGGAAVCAKSAPPAGYTCTGAQVKLFDDSNGYGVVNGAKSPTFSTKGKAYCVVSITTYHWNNGAGKAPGRIGLSGSGRVGPVQAKGSAGQGGAPNVNWAVGFPTAPKPTVINGTYSCSDSDPATWAQNQQSGGKGFCIVYAVPATGSGPVTGAGTKAKPAKKPSAPTPAKSGGAKTGKLAIKAAPDTGKPPLTVTFTLSSPKVVQWRVDYGDGQSQTGIGRPPGSLTHTYRREGDYRPRLTVIASQNAATSSSAATSVAVHNQQLMSLKAQPASGAAPLRVTFSLGTTVQSITTWSLDFGDGRHTGGAGKPPASVAHTYAKDGSYKATFSVKPGQYALVATFAQVTVGGGTPPVLSLSAAPASGRHPLAVTFTLGLNIPGRIVSWQLQFGDGRRAGGSGRPPATVSHTYATAGRYAAYLVVAQQQAYGGVQYVVPRGGLAITVG